MFVEFEGWVLATYPVSGSPKNDVNDHNGRKAERQHVAGPGGLSALRRMVLKSGLHMLHFAVAAMCYD